MYLPVFLAIPLPAARARSSPVSGYIVVQEQLIMVFWFCIVLQGGLLGPETASTAGNVDACAVGDQSTLLFTLIRKPLLGASYCIFFY